MKISGRYVPGLTTTLAGSIYGYISIIGTLVAVFFLVNSLPWIYPVGTLVLTIPFMLIGVIAKISTQLDITNNLLLEQNRILISMTKKKPASTEQYKNQRDEFMDKLETWESPRR